jgi:hypothetical protein
MKMPNRKMKMHASRTGIEMISTSTMKASTRRVDTPSNSSGWAIGSYAWGFTSTSKELRDDCSVMDQLPITLKRCMPALAPCAQDVGGRHPRRKGKSRANQVERI